MDIPATDNRRHIDVISGILSDCGSRRDAPPCLAKRGLWIVESRFTQPGKCHTYVFGREKWYRKMSNSDVDEYLLEQGIVFLGEKYESHGCPIKGAIAVYFWKCQYPAAVHFGKIVHDGRVRSKWGTGPVYEHRLDAVPTAYGDCVTFFKRPRRKKELSDESLEYKVLSQQV